jgi:hypothetical protein
MSKVTYFTFYETPIFTKRLHKVASMEILFNLQTDLIANPKLGDVISGTNGVRKARIADRKNNRGKSGSFRYIYLYLEQAEIIYLFMIYAKNEQGTLSSDEKKIVAFLAEQYKTLYGETE